jgi:hypothetical protein
MVEDDEIANEIRRIAPKLRALTELNDSQANQLKGLQLFWSLFWSLC